MRNSERTQFLYDTVEELRQNSTTCCDFDPSIDFLLRDAMAIADGDAFLQNMRPDPSYYIAILKCTRAERELYTSPSLRKETEGAFAYNSQTGACILSEAELSEADRRNGWIPIRRDMFRLDVNILRTARKDVLHLLGADFEGPGLGAPLARRPGKPSKEKLRLEELNLCLRIPALRYRDLDTVLTKFLASNPIHLRNPIDALYAFVLRSRDANAAGFNSLQAQEAYIQDMLARLKEDGADDGIADEGFLPTRALIQSFNGIEAGDFAGFEAWIRETKSSFDRKDHRYGVRAHLQENLVRIARRQDAEVLFWEIARDLPGHGYILERVDALAQHPRELDYHGIISDQIFEKTRDHAAEPGRLTTEQTEYRGMFLATDGIGDDFYHLWHVLGVRFMLKHRGRMPEHFDRQNDWRAYYEALVAGGEREQDALCASIPGEPVYLTTLRSYLDSGEISGTDQEFRCLAKRLEKAADRFSELVGTSAFLYIFSDWHYACVRGKRKDCPEGADPCPAYDTDKQRLKRITRPVRRIVRGNRTEITDVPRGLLILTELKRMEASIQRDGTSCDLYSERELVPRINLTLTEYGYAPLDVRRRMDFLFYAAMRIVDRDGFELSDMLDALMESIRSYTFDAECQKILACADGIAVRAGRAHAPERE